MHQPILLFCNIWKLHNILQMKMSSGELYNIL